jgi:hypothetical protein
MPTPPSPAALEEYRALRATIRERGTARLAIAAFTFVSWAALAVAVRAFLTQPVATLVPLLVLVAGFEVVFTLHIGVERVGRYLQVYFEPADDEPPAWERTLMRFARDRAARRGAPDPLFAGLFVLAAILNVANTGLLSVESEATVLGMPVELAVFGLLHLVFLLRVAQARRLARDQREADLAYLQRGRAGP